LGILGGLFNPPHVGHLVCAQEAWWQLELQSVMLMPVGEPPHRVAEFDPGAETRYELCKAAVEGDGRLSVSRMEIDRAGPSYAVDTLRLLKDHAPDDELFFIMGADAAVTLSTWKEPKEILRLATLGVAERAHLGRDDVRGAIDPLGGSDRVQFFSMPDIEVSSTLVRERVASDGPIRYLVPEAVAQRIRERHLYHDEGAA
jgi:nicotinate-nucleotide adenylyltransferase